MPEIDHICHFCGDSIDPRGLHRHHLNHDHSDNRPENVVDAHPSCHLRYHGAGTGRRLTEIKKLEALIAISAPREQARIIDALPQAMQNELLHRAMSRVSWD